MIGTKYAKVFPDPVQEFKKKLCPFFIISND